jgi:hypothetical protein
LHAHPEYKTIVLHGIFEQVRGLSSLHDETPLLYSLDRGNDAREYVRMRIIIDARGVSLTALGFNHLEVSWVVLDEQRHRPIGSGA